MGRSQKQVAGPGPVEDPFHPIFHLALQKAVHLKEVVVVGLHRVQSSVLAMENLKIWPAHFLPGVKLSGCFS